MMRLRDRIKEFRRVSAHELQPNPKNWRTHPVAQQDALRGVLAEVGIAGAVLARETAEGGLMLIDGHLRTDVMHDQEIPVLVLDVDEAEADKLLATIDPLAAMAEADAGKLDELLREIDTGSEALQEMLAKLAEDAGVLDGLDAKEIEEDEVPEVPVDPITKPGDLWILGEHRLLCGDSTKAEDVERLMAGKRAGAVVTDPPYGGILNKTNGHGKLKEAAKKYGGGDWDYRPSGELLRWIASFNHAIIWGGNYFASDLPDGRGWLVWDKKNGQSSFADAELAWTNLDQAVRMIAENVGTIGDRAHPTQKPVQVMRWAIEMTSGDLLDPFLGSGTTLIAAEQLGRKCYGMEISPQYCDVIVKRWETLTGRKAVRDAR
jgi:hypothetical protein